MSATLSVVMPVYNEAAHLPASIDALVEAVGRSGLDAELVLSDDGSADGSAEVARESLGGRLPLQVVSRPNRGRFAARRAGLEAATGEWALLLDARAQLFSNALRFVGDRMDAGEEVWTAHVHVLVDGNPYGAFWKLLAELAWEEYFSAPRTTSFDTSSFDRYPKGTGCFLAPRELLLEAVDQFRTGYGDVRHANDDTPLIRWIAERQPIHVSPEFACIYLPRSSLQAFVRHAYHRGLVFLDGHGRPESRFYPAVIGFYPLSALLFTAALRRPGVLPAAALAVAGAAGSFAVAKRRTPFEVASLATLAPVYAIGHGLGMWRGLAMLLGNRLR